MEEDRRANGTAPALQVKIPTKTERTGHRSTWSDKPPINPVMYGFMRPPGNPTYTDVSWPVITCFSKSGSSATSANITWRYSWWNFKAKFQSCSLIRHVSTLQITVNTKVRFAQSQAKNTVNVKATCDIGMYVTGTSNRHKNQLNRWDTVRVIWNFSLLFGQTSYSPTLHNKCCK